VYSFGFVSDFTIKMLMPPSSFPQSHFLKITASLVGGGGIDGCYIDISGIIPNNFSKLTVSAGMVQSYDQI